MVRYKEIEELAEEKFRRLTEVKKATFKRMVEILEEEDRRKKARSGRRSKLCVEDRLLMALEYIIEYWTYFHIGQSYGAGESNCFNNKVGGRDINKTSRFCITKKKRGAKG